MLNRSIVLKLWLAFTALILVVMIPLELALHHLLRGFYAQQVTEPLLFHSEQLARLLAVQPEAIGGAPMMGRMVGGEVVVVDRSGQPEPYPGTTSEWVPAEAVRRALAGSTVVDQATRPDGRVFIVTGVPIPDRGGAVLLLAPAEPLQQSLTLARRLLWLAGAGTLLLGTGIALMLSRHLLKPVIAIEKATRSIARGDFSTCVPVTSADEIGQLAAAVNQMTSQLEIFESRRREFLANVAHELRTPLSYIRGYAQALAEGLVSAPEDRERYLKVVQEEAVRLGRLVDDLMDLAELEDTQMALERAPVDLRIPVDQAAATIRPRAAEKGIELNVQLPPDLPQIEVDGGRIQQVVFNLLDNGLRHTPEGGRLAVTARADADWVTVYVSDTGQGFDPELAPLLFERFYKRHSGGRGLGLAIVRSIVQAHGGEVGAESKPGVGTAFWFRLPLGNTEIHT